VSRRAVRGPASNVNLHRALIARGHIHQLVIVTCCLVAWIIGLTVHYWDAGSMPVAVALSLLSGCGAEDTETSAQVGDSETASAVSVETSEETQGATMNLQIGERRFTATCPTSDRAKKIVHEATTMDALRGAACPVRRSTHEGPDCDDVMAHVYDAGFKVLVACSLTDSVGGDFNAAVHALEFSHSIGDVE